MAKKTLYNHVWDRHKVATLPNGQDQIFIGLHLVHEVTSPQAFAKLAEKGVLVAYPNRTASTLDHIIPTDQPTRPFQDPQAELMVTALEENVAKFKVPFFGVDSGRQGIVHVVGPELGLTQPGMTIVCGDSHTSTHGAFGSLAFGIGTTEVGQVLETQTLALSPLKVRQILVNGQLAPGVFAKDVILAIIQKLGVKGGLGFAYEYAGDVFEAMSMDERLTVCNMSIEGGARIGYVNPDAVTEAYLFGREYAPNGEAFEKAKTYWAEIRTAADAQFDDVVTLDGAAIEPMVTWGINPGQSVGVNEPVPTVELLPADEQDVANEAYAYMKLTPGTPIKGTPIQVAFIGSCTNSRLSDLQDAAKVMAGRKVADGVRCLVVPGSQQVKQEAEALGLHEVFQAAGAQWREPGCSMCLAMNPDKLIGDEVCASSSNRNFIGRQGSPTGRTLLMSPAMVAAAAVTGAVADVRELL